MNIIDFDPAPSNSTWETPVKLFQELDDEFGFELDVCATKENAKCERFYTSEDDGLVQPWGGVVWMNPPYGREIGKWVRKAYETAREKKGTVVCLLPSRTETEWFQEYCTKGEVRFLKGRLHFNNAKNPAPFASIIVIFRSGRVKEYEWQTYLF